MLPREAKNSYLNESVPGNKVYVFEHRLYTVLYKNLRFKNLPFTSLDPSPVHVQ